MRILIVEDDPIIAADLEDRLQEFGYQVIGPASTGEEAIALGNQTPLPDMVLMDIQLEGSMDGIEVAHQLSAKYPDLPIIFLTSNADDGTFSRAKTSRPAAFLSKPFRGRDLKHAIELAINSISRSQKSEKPIEEQTYLLHDRMFIKLHDRMVRIFFKDVLWVEADDYYCKIVTHEREYLVGHTLKKFNEIIADMPDMMRVHRSFTINLTHIEEIGDIFVHINRKQIPISKAAKDALLTRLHKM